MNTRKNLTGVKPGTRRRLVDYSPISRAIGSRDYRILGSRLVVTRRLSSRESRLMRHDYPVHVCHDHVYIHTARPRRLLICAATVLCATTIGTTPRVCVSRDRGNESGRPVHSLHCIQRTHYVDDETCTLVPMPSRNTTDSNWRLQNHAVGCPFLKAKYYTGLTLCAGPGGPVHY